LSPFDYSQLEHEKIASRSGDPELLRKIDELIKAGCKRFKLKVRPILIGDQIEWVDSDMTSHTLNVNLERLLTTKPNS